ncbi:catechol 2,3-dioxygenase-like lactoylglutathione lyase family enzyme [Okibacterium sp. HSC-33S16]|uniref:VOC family protein n=1 Tax=Okibacterium sp. HSC-33S16 TaxID=2910965 RepID=UPI00209FA700|nr:VOC family protein [Okibacterium sp. HSC-33S16]MCP2031896.1 catechol 2,3-dioxygenase-like lactoylglutathione lyase family enzyme [Okibacterium sp. HSC-33S16]
MDSRVHFITVATADLDAARHFYQEGLGWEPLVDVPDEILFFQIGPGLTLGLYDARTFTNDLLAPGTAQPSGFTLSHNVDSATLVDETIERLLAAGATLVTKPQFAAFGGYHGHVADPNGIVWEIAHNPAWSVDETGAVLLGE